MMKNLMTTLAVLALLAGGSALKAQWAQYHADALPGEDASVPIRDAGSSLLNGTSVVMADPENASNNFWKYDVDLEAADELKYNWYPSYIDPDAADPVYTPAPMTIAAKMQWIDTTGYSFGTDIELRGVYKVQAKIILKNDLFHVSVKDKTADSAYVLPETFDPREWHVLRLTIDNENWAVYVNESETPHATGTAGKQVDKHLAILGAYAENAKSGIMVDWMGMIEDAAAGPADEALPAGIFTPPAVGISFADATARLSIYPNPVSELLMLEVDRDMVNARYELFSVSGQLIQDGLVSGVSSSIDVSEFHAGMYLLKLQGNSQTATKSFIIK